jgi:hypothetical protein
MIPSLLFSNDECGGWQESFSQRTPWRFPKYYVLFPVLAVTEMESLYQSNQEAFGSLCFTVETDDCIAGRVVRCLGRCDVYMTEAFKRYRPNV